MSELPTILIDTFYFMDSSKKQMQVRLQRKVYFLLVAQTQVLLPPAVRSQLSFHCSRSNSTVTSAFSVYTVEVEERNSFLKTKLIISEIIHSHTNKLSYLTAMALRLNANIIVNDADQPIYLAYRKKLLPSSCRHQ